jgi:uncharacterized surface protein with fasciclin (FAS1) repeats
MNSVIDTLFNIRELQMFCTAIKIVRLTRTLHSAGPFTVFAPADRAFTQLSSTKLQQLISDVPLLTKIVTNHIVAGDFTYQDLLKMCKRGERGITLTSIDGSPLYIDLGDGIRIGDSTVIATDILAENGIVHPIDRLIVHPIDRAIVPQMPEQPQKSGWMSEYSTR